MAVVVEPTRAAPLSFTHDIISIINRAGCNAGACHAKPNGQKGFSLSVFSYNPSEDYREIVKESRGRRVFPEAPEQSLVLQKPAMSVEHEGGLRFERDSDFYNKIKRWIGTGMVYANDEDPQLVAVRVYPKQRRYGRKATQSLLVQATYSDGAVRDVTHLSVFESRDKDIVAVDTNGRMKVKDRFGEAAVMVRFRDRVDVATVTVPTDYGLADSTYETLPVNNELDTHVYAQLKRLGFFPSDTCSDSTFLRRAYLDAVGLLPTADESRAFLTADDPQKRQKLIDRLLEHPRWADHWATKWSDLIRPNDVLVGTESVYVLDQWTREQFRKNVPYDQFVRRIITAEGNTVANGAGIVFRDRPKPEDVSELVAQVFLGVRIQCARCHHHPLEKWSQKDFYQLAAYFGQVKAPGGRGGLTQRGAFVFHAGEGEVKHPLTDDVMHPTPPDVKAIKTKSPNLMLSEFCPKLATVADKFSVIRSVHHTDSFHGGGNHWMMTGQKSFMPTQCDSVISFHPSYGSVVSFARGYETKLPAYMAVGQQSRSGGPNFLGPQHAPFVVGGDPSQPDFKVRDIILPPDISEGRAVSRRNLHRAIDRMVRFQDARAEDPAVAFDKFYQQAVDTVSSPNAQAAFDINSEPDSIRDMYGRCELGQRLLLSRRLVEAGVPFVTCYYGGWDHHGGIIDAITGRTKSGCPCAQANMPTLDRGLTALIKDLDQRGLLDTTLVLAFGEFGRTAHREGTSGRGHWSNAMSIFAAGAGIPGGQAIGATDEIGNHAAVNKHSPADLAASIYTKMGVDPHQHLNAADGRPVPLVKNGQIIKELFV